MEVFLHKESLLGESHIRNHYQHQKCEYLRLPEELEERLETHLLKPWVEIVGEEESEMDREINPKEHQVDCMDYKVVEEISLADQKVGSKGIKKTYMDSRGFLDQILETTMSLEVGEERQGFRYFVKFQIQILELQVTVKVQDELLVMTLQYQTMKRNCEVNGMVEP